MPEERSSHRQDDDTKMSGKETQRQLRYYRDILVVSGNGIIIFGILSISRFLLGLLLNSKELEDYVKDAKDMGVERLPALIIFACIILVAFLVRIYIGLCAIKEGRMLTDKRRTAYLIVSVLLIIMYVIESVVGIHDLPQSEDAVDSVFFIILDITSVYTYLSMVISNIKIRSLTAV